MQPSVAIRQTRFACRLNFSRFPIFRELHLQKSKKQAGIRCDSVLNYHKYCYTSTLSRNFSMAEDSLYLGTSVRGITKEIEFPVPWGVIAGKTYGNPEGSPVLCLHGWLDNCNSFDGLIPLLPKDHYFVFIDLPGHGKSSAIPIGSFYSVYDHIAVVERIRRHFEWPHFSFISHSMGGNISAVYAGTFPERVDKLIIIDALGVIVVRQGGEVNVLRQSIESYAKYEKERNRTPPSYTYEVAKSKLLAANKSLGSHYADVLLERGAAQQEDGTYIFLRDIRHKFRNPSGIFNIDSGVQFMSRIEAETIHIIAKEGILCLMTKDPDYLKLLDRVSQEGFKKCEFYKRVDVPGEHHVHLCNAENVIEHVKFMLERPVRSALLEMTQSAAHL